MPVQPLPRARRGFALLTPERRKEVAAKGGSSVPAHKRSFSVDHSLALRAGSKGGSTSRGGGRPKLVEHSNA